MEATTIFMGIFMFATVFLGIWVWNLKKKGRK